MKRLVYIIHAPEDIIVAEQVCAAIEAAGVGCRLDSRDRGRRESNKKFAEKAIRAAQVMVVVFSANTNRATGLAGDMNVALNAGLRIIPLRIDEAEPEGVIQYYLADTHWLEMSNPPKESQLKRLIDTVDKLLQRSGEQGERSSLPVGTLAILSGSRFGRYLPPAVAGLISALIIFGAVRITLALAGLAGALRALVSNY